MTRSDTPAVTRGAVLFSGILLALAVFALALLQVILLFGEGQDPVAASRAGWALALLSAGSYALGELFFFPRTPHKSLFALAYYLTFALMAALAFAYLTGADLTLAFDGNGDAARTILLTECFRLCAVNATMLVVRIALEFVRYIRSIPKG